MAYEQIVNLNLGFDLKPSLTVVQYDSGRLLHLYIDDFAIPANSEVRIYVKKPSGHEIYNSCTYEDNLVITPGTLQMFAEVGVSHGLIQIITNGTYLTSFQFDIIVNPNPTETVHIDSSDEYTVLTDLIEQAKLILEEEAKRVEAEKQRVLNETERISAESQRVSECNGIKTEMNDIKNTVVAQGNAAEEKGNAAEQQGNAAEENSNYAKEQGDYAKEQGDYAKQQATRIEDALGDIDINLDYVHNDSTKAYLVATVNDGSAGIYDDDVYLTSTAGGLHTETIEISDAVLSYNSGKSALQISFK